jgi:hypothetical protein
VLASLGHGESVLGCKRCYSLLGVSGHF